MKASTKSYIYMMISINYTEILGYHCGQNYSSDLTP